MNFKLSGYRHSFHRGKTFVSLLAIILFTALLVITPYMAIASNTNDPQTAKWLLDYKGHSTSEVSWDKRLPKLLKRGLPDSIRMKWWGNKTLSATALDLLSGPPEQVQVESDRYVTLAAAIAHNAWNKGLLWVDVDTPEPEMIFVYLAQDASPKFHQASMTIYTNENKFVARLPPEFISSLRWWKAALKERTQITKITDVTLVDAAGKATQLSVDLLDE